MELPLRITVNGEVRSTNVPNLGDLCRELGFEGARFATALNGIFIPASLRETTGLNDGDAVEVVSPRQGG